MQFDKILGESTLTNFSKYPVSNNLGIRRGRKKGERLEFDKFLNPSTFARRLLGTNFIQALVTLHTR